MAFKAITVNTPAEDPAHIMAEDDAAIYQGIFGEDGVLNVGSKLKATILSNNSVRVADGAVVVGGHIGRNAYADYQDMTIENGTSGQMRNDLIVAQFATTGSGGVDTFTLAVKKGTAGSSASDPVLTQEDIYAGGKQREVPLYRVKLEGISITGVDQLFKIIPTIPDLLTDLGEMKSALENIYPVGSIYMSVVNTNPSAYFGGTWVSWGSGRVPVGVDAKQTEFAAVEKTGGSKTHKLTTNEMPAHTHRARQEAYNVGPGSGDTVLTYREGVNGAPTTSTGGGAAHNNLQPYITCYMWKRTA